MKEESTNLFELLLFSDLTNSSANQLILQKIQERFFLKTPDIKEIIEKNIKKYNYPNPSLAEPLLGKKGFFDSSDDKTSSKNSPKPKKP